MWGHLTSRHRCLLDCGRKPLHTHGELSHSWQVESRCSHFVSFQDRYIHSELMIIQHSRCRYTYTHCHIILFLFHYDTSNQNVVAVQSIASGCCYTENSYQFNNLVFSF